MTLRLEGTELVPCKWSASTVEQATTGGSRVWVRETVAYRRSRHYIYVYRLADVPVDDVLAAFDERFEEFWPGAGEPGAPLPPREPWE